MGLSRIDFNAGNRPPTVEDLYVSKTSGTLPLSIETTVEAGDPEQDELTYIWQLGDGSTKQTTEPKPSDSQYSSQELTIKIDEEINKEKLQEVYIVSHPVNPEGAGTFTLGTIQFKAEE